MAKSNGLSRRALLANIAGATSVAALIQTRRDPLLAEAPTSSQANAGQTPPGRHPASAYPWFAAVTEADLRLVEQEIPEILQLRDPDIRHKLALVYASFLKESPYKRISEARGKYDLARHSRHAALIAMSMVKILSDVWGIEVRHDICVASAILHDCDSLVSRGKPFMHAQLAGVRCYEAGLPDDIVNIVTRHPFTPPHIHVIPPNIESVIVAYADLGAADPIFFIEGQPTHLEFKKRFFSLD